MDIVLKVFLIICGFLAILTGLFLNLRVIVQTVRQKLGMNGIFPFFMAFGDLFNMTIDLVWLFNKIVPVQVPIFVSAIHLFVFFMGLFLSISAFFSYMLLRSFIVVWPMKCRLYLKRRYVYSVAAFNFSCTFVLCCSVFYVYSDMLFSDTRTLLSDFKRRPSPLGFIILRYIFLAYLFLLFASTILLTTISCCRLSKKGISDTDDSVQRKRRAMLTLLMCMLVFVVCQFIYFVVMAIYYGESRTAGIALSTNGFVFLFFLRVTSFIANPLLYYRTKSVTTRKVVRPLQQQSQTSETKTNSVKSTEDQKDCLQNGSTVNF